MTNKIWHPAVHGKHKESLVFYRAHVQPFESQDVSQALGDLLERERVQSLKAYLVFGRHDLLFRGWMHGNVISDFKFKLAKALNTDITPQSFVARESFSDHRPVPPQTDPIWQRIHDMKCIRSVQSDEHHALIESLIAQNLLLPMQQLGTAQVRFYTAVSLPSVDADQILQKSARTIYDDLQRRNTIHGPAVHLGEGFCTILIEGSVKSEHFFTIGSFISWLLDNLHQPRAVCETYIVVTPNPFIGSLERIDDRTFIEERGRDAFIDDFLPELYNDLSPRGEEVAYFARAKIRSAAFPAGAKGLLAEYLRGYLSDQPSKSGVALLVFFAEIEGYLRSTYATFIGKMGQDPKQLFTDLNISKRENQFLALGEYLKLITRALETSAETVPLYNEIVGTNWEALVQLRNKLAHGDVDLADWQRHIEILLTVLPKLQILIDHISRVTGTSPRFTFLQGVSR